MQPVAEDNIQNTKTESLKELLLTGRNVATTHSMHERLVPLAEAGLLEDYNIIIDEVPEVVQSVSCKSFISKIISIERLRGYFTKKPKNSENQPD